MKQIKIENQILQEASKQYYRGKCLWSDCKKFAIKSHSHSEKNIRKISFENHVIGLSKNFLSMQKGNFFHKYGILQASIFNGFFIRNFLKV